MSNLTKEINNKKSSLGRGLGSLLGQNSEAFSNTPISAAKPIELMPVRTEERTPAEARIWTIGIDKIKPSQFQPRSHFEKDKLEELSLSIKQNGILQPIIVRKSPAGGFEIVAGERRWRASQLAGLHEIPVIIKDYDDRTALELAIIENVQREDLNAIEEAEAYQRLAVEFSLTQVQIAEKVGKDRATVANALRILSLPLKIKDMVAQGKLSVGHAKVLLALPNVERQIEYSEIVIRQNLSVRKLEKLVTEAQHQKNPDLKMSADQGVTNRLIHSLSEEVQRLVGTKVTIDYLAGKGKLSIQFYSDEELTSIVEKLRNGCQKV